MANQPLISIITVTYNAHDTILPTLRSVDAQTGVVPEQDFEHLIIDGASSDETMEIVKSHAAPYRRVISEPDRGIYDAMNKGMDRARGEYYIFLNAGDAFSADNTLAKIVDTIRRNSMPGIVYGQTQIVDSNGAVIGPRHLTAPQRLDYRSFAQGMVVCHQAFIALARIAPRYDLSYRFSADFDWCIQCMQHSRKNVFINETIINYLSEGTTTRNRYASLRERFKIMCYYYGTVPTVLRHFKFLPRFLKATKATKETT